MCPHCRAFITTDDKICPYCDTPVGPKAVDRRDPGTILGGLVPSGQFVTFTILTINVGLFIVTALASGGSFMGISSMALIKYGGAYGPFVFGNGEWWRLITAGFLHGGILHILMNSWALMDVGSHCEAVFGQKRMITVYLLSTAGGFFASMLWRAGLSIGASAGLFGLIGAMIAIGFVHKTYEAQAIKSFYIRWAVYGLLFGLLPIPIDNAAHIGGLATGFAVACLAGTPKLLENHPKERFWQGIMIVTLLTTAYCFAKMVQSLTMPKGF